MKILFKAKDGGLESKVFGYWLFESKRFGSIVLLNFKDGSREAFHTHAFDAISWVLFGSIKEIFLNYTKRPIVYRPSFRPIFTSKDTFHKVMGLSKNTWILSFRGRWVDSWKEYLPKTKEPITLTHGRKII